MDGSLSLASPLSIGLGVEERENMAHLICPQSEPSSSYDRLEIGVVDPDANSSPQTGNSGNQLKLSVGYEDSDEGEYSERGGVADNIRQWHMQSGPTRTQEFANDFDVDLSSQRVKAIISGDNLLFQPLAQGNFVEEVFSEKGPKILHGYLFGDIIGEGSYAKVKEVVEQFSLVRRAVKIVKGNRLRKIPNGAENVAREIRILRKVEHENVIRLIEVFRKEEKNKLYVVMEFCMGSVQQLIDTSALKRLMLPEAHAYFRQLIAGLEYLHSLGIVHKDIKPGNLLLSPDFQLKISDFGVAEELSLFQSTDRCQLVQGTPKFQAPELVSGSTDTFSGFKADLWSSGVTLYNMVSGEYPFQGEVIMRLFDNIARKPLEMPTTIEVDSELESLLRGLLNKDADSRFSIEAVKHSAWYLLTFSKDSFEHSLFPDRKQSVCRPLSVSRALEQLYGQIPEDRIIVPNEGEEEEPMSISESVASCRLSTGRDAEEAQKAKSVPRRNRSFLSCLMPNNSP